MSYGAGGGGFMSQAAGSSPSKAARKPSALRPCTIYQLLHADQPHGDADFEVDGVELREVSLVACVRNSSAQATHFNLTVEDGTGQCDIRYWLPSGQDVENLNLPQVNDYARFIGILKTFNGKRHFNATIIKPVTDMNELSYHPLECIAAHLYHTRGPPPRLNGGVVPGGGRMNGITGVSAAGANPYTNGAGAAAAGGADEGNAYNELNPVQRSIMKFVEAGKPETRSEGVNLNAIARSVAGGQLQKVRTEVEKLIEEGYLYTTIDEDHVSSTNT